MSTLQAGTVGEVLRAMPTLCGLLLHSFSRCHHGSSPNVCSRTKEGALVTTDVRVAIDPAKVQCDFILTPLQWLPPVAIQIKLVAACPWFASLCCCPVTYGALLRWRVLHLWEVGVFTGVTRQAAVDCIVRTPEPQDTINVILYVSLQICRHCCEMLPAWDTCEEVLHEISWNFQSLSAAVGQCAMGRLGAG